MISPVSRIFLGFGAFALGIVFALPAPVHAQAEYNGIEAEYSEIESQGIIFANICTSATEACACRDSGKCTLEDVLQVFVNLSYFILGISGAVLLFVFMYGGFSWLISRGDSKLVERGRATMVGGVIGLVIIFGAYVIINFIIAGLKQGEGPTGNLENTISADAKDDSKSGKDAIDSGIESAKDVINSN